MHFKGVVFDLDGTLLDTLADIANAMNRVLEAEGLPSHPLDAYRYFVGEGATALARKVIPGEPGEELVERIRTRFIEEYSRSWRVETGPYPGIEEMLRAVREKGAVMGVLSNKPHDFTVLCVETFLDPSLFGAVAGERPGIPRKPHPAGALDVASQLGLAPEEVLYVGDTAIDMETAERAAMYGVGVLWGSRGEEELRSAGAREVISHPMDLLGLI